MNRSWLCSRRNGNLSSLVLSNDSSSNINSNPPLPLLLDTTPHSRYRRSPPLHRTLHLLLAPTLLFIQRTLLTPSTYPSFRPLSTHLIYYRLGTKDNTDTARTARILKLRFQRASKRLEIG